MDFVSSPLAIELGEQPLAFQRGAVIVHIACFAVSALVCYSLPVVLCCWKRCSWRVACVRMRCPGILSISLSVLAGGAAEASTSLLWYGSTPADVALGSLDAVLFVAVPIIWTLYVMSLARRSCKCVLKPYLKEKKDAVAAAAAAAATAATTKKPLPAPLSPSSASGDTTAPTHDDDVGGRASDGGDADIDLLQLELDLIAFEEEAAAAAAASSPPSAAAATPAAPAERVGRRHEDADDVADGSDGAGAGDEGRGPDNKKHCFARNCPWIYRAYRWVAVNHSEWVDIKPVEISDADAEAIGGVVYTTTEHDGDGGDGGDGSKKKIDWYALRDGVVYEDYNNALFAPPEIVVTSLLGAVAGVSAGVLTRTACVMYLFIGLFAVSAHLFALLYFRPLLNRGLAFFVTTSTAVTAATVLLALLQFLDQLYDAQLSFLSVTIVQTVISVVATMLNWLAMTVVVFNLWTAYRAHRPVRAESGTHMTFAGANLGLETELLNIDGGRDDHYDGDDEDEIDLSFLHDSPMAAAFNGDVSLPVLETEEEAEDEELLLPPVPNKSAAHDASAVQRAALSAAMDGGGGFGSRITL
jgi:hypothetical protein